MEEFYRTPGELLGDCPEMLQYWDQLPDQVKRKLLASEATPKTLGELQLLSDQFRHLSEEPPAVF